MRSGPMASAGLGPSFGQRDWACGPHYKVETQGPNGPGDPMPYNSPPLDLYPAPRDESRTLRYELSEKPSGQILGD